MMCKFWPVSAGHIVVLDVYVAVVQWMEQFEQSLAPQGKMQARSMAHILAEIEPEYHQTNSENIC
jgi:hypothetical protein